MAYISILKKATTSEPLTADEQRLMKQHRMSIDEFNQLRSEYAQSDAKPLTADEEYKLESCLKSLLHLRNKSIDMKSFYDQFDINVFKKLFLLMKASKRFEGEEHINTYFEMAVQLATLFGSVEDALDYLSSYEKKNKTNLRPIHDGCLFSLPEWPFNIAVWRTLAKKNMLNPHFKKALPFAKKIEKYSDEKNRKEALERIKKDISTSYNMQFETEYLEPLPSFDTFLSKKLDELKGNIKREIQFELEQNFLPKDKKGEITKEERREIALKVKEIPEPQRKMIEEKIRGIYHKRIKDEYLLLENDKKMIKEDFIAKRLRSVEKTISALATKSLEAFSFYPDKLDNYDPEKVLQTTITLGYDRFSENPKAARLYAPHGVPESAYELYLTLKPTGGRYIPDIVLDGSDIGHEGYYIKKLSPDDPQAAILGYITGCCQSIGRAGETCAIYGITNPFSGFYVLCKGDPKSSKSTDEIRGQAWCWVADKPAKPEVQPKPKEDVLVLDSIESQTIMRENPKNRNILRSMFLYLSHQLVNSGNYRRVVVGTGSNTPRELVPGFLTSAALFPRMAYGTGERLADPLIYSDAKEQNIMADQSCVDYLYAYFSDLKSLANSFKKKPGLRKDPYFLKCAVEHNDVKLLQFLFEELDKKELFELLNLYDPIIDAIRQKKNSVCEFLINNTDFKKKEFQYFQETIRSDNEWAFNILLEKGGNVNVSTEKEGNLLDHAIMFKSTKFVEILLSKGLRPTIPLALKKLWFGSTGRLTGERTSPKYEAERIEIFNKLLAVVPENKKKEFIKNILEAFPISDPNKGYSKLLSHLLDINTEMLTVSDISVMLDKFEPEQHTSGSWEALPGLLLRFLKQVDNIPKIVNETRWFHHPLAAANTSTEIVEYLLKNGANINSDDGAILEPLTILTSAISSGNLKRAKFLLQYYNPDNPLDPNIDVQVGKKMYNALMFAVEQGNKEIVQMLLDKKARIDLKNAMGETILEMARRLNKEKTSQERDELLQILATYTQVLSATTAASPVSEVKDLKETKMMQEGPPKKTSDVKPDIKSAVPVSTVVFSPISETISVKQKQLFEAIQKDDIDAVRRFLSERSDLINKPYSKKQETPLIMAARTGKEKIVGLLLEEGADVHLKNKDGETALMQSADEGHVEIVALLIKSDTSSKHLDARDEDGDTALMRAIYGGCFGCARLLVENHASLILTNNRNFNVLTLPEEEINEEGHADKKIEGEMLEWLKQLRSTAQKIKR